MMALKTAPILILFFTRLLLTAGCTVSLNGGVIPPDLKTINVGFFENNANLVVPTLSQQFTEALKDRIRSTTRLSIVNGEGNARMSGSIVGYSFAPISIQATSNNVAPIAGASQLTITVHVKFVYDADKKLNFEKDFSKSMNYSGDIASQEQTLILAINKQLIDDIFNAAFNNW
jgi:Lipopolysaccharide-assembly